jgi:hypothetical protein
VNTSTQHDHADAQADAQLATPAAAWHKAARTGHLYRMPGSGNVARLRRPSLRAMSINGVKGANPLSADVLRLIAASDDTLSRPTDEQMIAAYKNEARAFQEAAALAFVEPQLILDREPDPDANEIGPGDVSDRDYVFIFYQLIQGEADRIRSFRLD